MKLHDDIRSDPPNERDKAWELIPWYVNGTLSEDEVRLVEAHAMDSDAFSEEIARQSALAEGVAKTDPFEVPLERSWETLRAQVEADVAARTPAKQGPSGWRAAFQGRGLVAAGGLVAASIALVVAFQFDAPPGGNDFVTLTSSNGVDVPVVRFQTGEAMEIDALQDLLAPLGVVSVTGPSQSGVYSAVLSEDADVEAIAALIRERAEIVFAAPNTSQ